MNRSAPNARTSSNSVGFFRSFRATAMGVSAVVLTLASCGSSGKPTLPAKVDMTEQGVESTGQVAAGDSAEPTSVRPRLVVGSPEPGLQFTLPSSALVAGSTVAGPTSPTERGASSDLNATGVTTGSVGSASATTPTPEAAAQQFGDAVVRGDAPAAVALLTADERGRVGSPARFADLLTREPTWLSVALISATPTSVVLEVSQTPLIDDVHGVVAPSATVTLPVTKENGQWRVRFDRRTTVSKYDADEARLPSDVSAWIQSRLAACRAPGAANKPTPTFAEYAGGLVGSSWLADTLCTKSVNKTGATASTTPTGANSSTPTGSESTTASATSAAVKDGTVGDIYALDDPQPLLDAFGTGSYDWARVVAVTSPQPMNVIAAPIGRRWLVVGLAPLKTTIP
jgi:hypothetical protein